MEAPSYKPGGQRFDSRWGHRDFLWTPSFQLHCNPGDNSASKTNQYKGGQCVGLTTLPASCTNCLEILGASTPYSPQGLWRDCFTFTYSKNGNYTSQQ